MRNKEIKSSKKSDLSSKLAFKEDSAYVIWLLSIVIFFLTIFFVRFDFSNVNVVWIVLFIFDIFAGSMAFLYLFAKVVAKLFDKKTFLSSLISLSTISIIFVGFFFFLIKLPSFFSINNASDHNENKYIYDSLQNTDLSNIALDKKVSISKAMIYPTIDPDPIVDCKFTNITTMKLRRSVCQKSTDCQINGKWYYYVSVNECEQAQQKYWTNLDLTTSNKNYPSGNSGFGGMSSTITCVVSYPCTGNTYTYEIDQSTCDFMKSGALSTCSTADAIKRMQEISNVTYAPIHVPTIDTSINFEPSPTIGVPFGYSNYPAD